MRRRDFFAACAAAPWLARRGHAASPLPSPFPVKFKQQPPFAAVMALAEPGLDEFPGEKTAMEIEVRLAAALRTGDLPVAAGCSGASPAPSQFRQVAPDVVTAVFDGRGDPATGWKEWRAALGQVRRAVFYSLPDGLVRYDIRSRNAGRLEHRVGIWKMTWDGGAVTHLEPVEETITTRAARGSAISPARRSRAWTRLQGQLTKGSALLAFAPRPGLRAGRVWREWNRRGGHR